MADYVNTTYHATNKLVSPCQIIVAVFIWLILLKDASAVLTFNGSALYVYGAKRPNHVIMLYWLDASAMTDNW